MFNKKPKITTFVETLQQIKKYRYAGIESFIIDDNKYSILSRNKDYKSHVDYDRIEGLISEIRNFDNNSDIIFNMDRLIHNDDISELYNLFNHLISININKIRILDAGIANIIRTKFPELNIQLNTETGNNNHRSIQFWKYKLGKQLDMIVLSKELDYPQIMDILSRTGIKSELQVHGNIMLMYTRRRVLNGLNKFKKDNDMIEVGIEEEKRPGEYFPLIDNPHGSYLLNSKLLCLMEELNTIAELGIDSILIDLRGYPIDAVSKTISIYHKALEELIESEDVNLSQYKRELPNLNKDFTKGFFLNNTTDKQPKKKITYNLNLRINKETKLDYIGEIVDVVKGRLIAIKTEYPLSLGDNITIDTPESKLIKLKIRILKDLKGNNIKKVSRFGIYLLNWSKGIVIKSNVYISVES